MPVSITLYDECEANEDGVEVWICIAHNRRTWIFAALAFLMKEMTYYYSYCVHVLYGTFLLS